MKLKLGRLPDARNVSLKIALSAELKAKIDRYAEIYSKTWAQEVDARRLIPHILGQFLADDRAFRRLEQAKPSSRQTQSNSATDTFSQSMDDKT